MANPPPPDSSLELPSDGIPSPPPPPPPPSNEPTALIASTFDEALAWLARWFHDRVQDQQPGDIKDLNNGLTALNRLMDAYKRLKALGELDPAAGEERDSGDGWEEILRTVERIAQRQQEQKERGQETGAEEFLPQ
jgi:hypothetical protein